MRLARLMLPVLMIAMFTTVGAGAQPDAPASWQAERINLPEALAKTRTLAIAEHGDDLLVITSVQSQMQLWLLRGGEFLPVKFEDKSPVTGSWVYLHVEGETAIVEINQEGELRPNYAVVRKGAAQLLRDTEGKPIKHRDLYVYESHGHAFAAQPEMQGADQDDYFIIQGDRMKPLMLPDDTQLTAEIAYLLKEPDGRLLLESFAGDETAQRFLFEDGRILALPEVPQPESVSAYDLDVRPTYFADRIVVTGNDRKADVGRAWVVTDGVPSVVKLEDGSTLKHQAVYHSNFGERVYLNCGDVDEFAATYTIYELDGETARQVTLKDGKLGTPHFALDGDVPLFVNFRGGRDVSLWQVEGAVATEVKFKGGGSVVPTPEFKVQTLNGRTFVHFITEEGDFVGVLKDGELLPLIPEEGFGVPDFGPAIFECDGDLFLYASRLVGESGEWFGYIDDDFRVNALKISDDETLTGTTIQPVVVGRKICVSVNHYGPDPRLYVIQR